MFTKTVYARDSPDVNKESKDKRGKTIGITMSWAKLDIDNDCLDLRHVSMDCQGLIDITCRSQMCFKCAYVKRCCQPLASTAQEKIETDDTIEFTL